MNSLEVMSYLKKKMKCIWFFIEFERASHVGAAASHVDAGGTQRQTLVEEGRSDSSGNQVENSVETDLNLQEDLPSEEHGDGAVVHPDDASGPSNSEGNEWYSLVDLMNDTYPCKSRIVYLKAYKDFEYFFSK